ncbi:Protein of unknown function [Pyronema omphalodes CBS 100304]|uniref:Uncharacterized protein n=1 Tax=Pyronema omphalodes (strain CBS 100304) TaxID=1076935 RepID=U4LDB6_PYROM|nr:Protein of unknown function [Pyronema omphalodes CBS 100304]
MRVVVVWHGGRGEFVCFQKDRISLGGSADVDVDQMSKRPNGSFCFCVIVISAVLYMKAGKQWRMAPVFVDVATYLTALPALPALPAL